MTSLRETIENFHAYVLEEDSMIEQEIVGADEDFKRTRLNVYQEGYMLRLLDILAKDFAAVKKLAGDELFEQLGRSYIHENPSTYFSVRDFGQHFPQHLAQNSSVDPLWIEMAEFEWVLENAIDAKDAPQLTFEDMAALSPESWAELRLTTHPSFHTVPFFYPVPTLWQALMQDKEKPDLTRPAEPTHWLVWRFNRQTYFRSTNKEQIWMIRALQRGENFSDVCAGLCEWMEEEKVIPFAAESLRRWITEGVFSTFEVGNT